MNYKTSHRRIEELKRQSDMVAMMSQQICADALAHNAKKAGMPLAAVPAVKLNTKYFRRLIGLRNGDLS